MFWGRGALQGMAGVGRGGQAFADSEGVGRHWWASGGRSQRSGSAPSMLLAALFVLFFFPRAALSIALPPFVCTGTPTSFTGQYLPHQRLEENHSGGRRSEY